MTVEKVLITGGAGFIGSWLTERLLDAGQHVVVLDDLSTGRESNLARARQHPNFEFRYGTVLDRLAVDEAMRDVDAVVHLAAAVGVELILRQPLRSFITNIRGSEHVLDAAHSYRRRVLVASTSEIYGKNDADSLEEGADRILGPPSVTRWAYSTSKAVEEIIALAYHRELGLPAIVCRFFNTVGPRQTAAHGMVIPRLVRQALAGKPMTVYGDGSQRRCFCHVDDTVEAVVGLLWESQAAGEVYNVGSDNEVTITELAERIIERTGSSSGIEYVPYERAYIYDGYEDMRRRRPDTTKVRQLIGWSPKHNLDHILDEAIADARQDIAGSPLGAR